MSDPARDHTSLTDEDLLRDAIPIDPEAETDEPDVEPEPEPEPETEPAPGDAAAPAAEGSARPPRIRHSATEGRPHEDAWNRTPNTTGHGAIHVKTFYAKLRGDAIEHMDRQINEWLDAHPQYEVKFVTTTVGMLKSKNDEHALFINVWV